MKSATLRAAPPAAEVKPARNARQNREKIMEAIRAAAIAEFSQNGLKGTSTQAIAERAGLTKPQLHYYIKGKEDLYEELLTSVVQDWKSMFVAGSTDPAKVLGDYIRLKLQLAFEKPEVSRIFTREVLDGGRNLEKFWPDSRLRTREKVDVINGWIARGLMKPVDAHALLMSIWAMTQFYADSAVQVQKLMKPKQAGWTPDREALVKELTAFVLRGCGISK